MKKFSLLLVLVLALVIAGCGKQSDNENEQINVAKSESNFDMSECIKWCEIMRNKDWLEEKMFGDCKSLCEASKAMEEWDESWCDSSDWIMKDSCYSSVAYETLNPKICEKIIDSMIKYGCYASIAEEKKDQSICNKIEDKMFKTICIESVQNLE